MVKTRRTNGHKRSYLGRSKGCNVIPGSKACRKCQKHHGMKCINCKSLEI